jgi:hypothetical protein
MTAPLAVPALMNVLLMLSQKAISTRLTPMFAPTADHAPMFALLKQFTRPNQSFYDLKSLSAMAGFFYSFFT